MKVRIGTLLGLAAIVTVAVTYAVSAATAGPGRVAMYLVNDGPLTTFWGAGGGNCAAFLTPGKLSPTKGTELRQESVLGTFLSYQADSAFTVPANPDAVMLKGWWSSGDGTCPGQTGDQTVTWR